MMAWGLRPEFSDMELARAKRDRRGFVVMCMALAIIVCFAGIALMGR
jgi:hypothetical protein